MQYRIVFRAITEKDLSKDCLFMPHPQDFEMHLTSLAQDAQWLGGVTEVHLDDSHSIVVTTDATLAEMKERFIPILQNHWGHLRYSSFDRLVTQ